MEWLTERLREKTSWTGLIVVVVAGAALLGWMPLTKVALMGGLVWLTMIALTKYPSVGSLSAMTAMPLLMALEGGDISSIVFCAVAAGFAFFRHKDNIERLRQGRELRYDESSKRNRL